MGLVLQSLRHYWRLHVGFVASLAIACAVLVGGLMVGDSLREGLKLRNQQRLGPVDYQLATPGRWFGPELAERLAAHTEARLAPVFWVESAAKSADDRVAAAQLLGADKRLWELAGVEYAPSPGEVLLNKALASALRVDVGDSVIFRFERPDALPSASALRAGDGLASLRLKVAAVRGGDWPLELDLRSSGQLPMNAFVALEDLERSLGYIPLNGILADCDCEPGVLDEAMEQAWRLEDAQLEIREVAGLLEVRSERVLLEPDVAEAALGLSPLATAISSWFVDEASTETSRSGYFFVAAAQGPADARAASLSQGLGPKQIALSDVLAAELEAELGGSVHLRLPVLGPRKRIVYAEADFEVARVYPMGPDSVDPSWMPAIPGMEGAGSCAEWQTGLPVDFSRIRPSDENFWQRYGGSPKAFISLDAARELWSSPYGQLTAVRLPPGPTVEELETQLRRELSPSRFGLFFQPVGAQMAAADPVNDFGQLFLGFNFFLIGSALFLVSIFAGFAVDRRRSQLGLLAALGYTEARVRGYLLLELGLVSAFGCVLGLLGALGVAQLLLLGLAGVWSAAVGNLAFPLVLSTSSMAAGALTTWLVGLAAAWLGVRYVLACSPWRNLRGEGLAVEGISSGDAARFAWFGLLFINLGLGVALLSDAARGPMRALVFFGCGGLVLAGALLLVWAWLRRSITAPPATLYAVGAAGLKVRPKSSFAVISTVAIGVYLVGGIGGGTLQPDWDPGSRASGTGGFAWAARLSIPMQEDLGTVGGLEKYGLNDQFQVGQIVGLGVIEGDDASCMNLGSAQRPRLLGVNATDFERRGAFHFISPAAGSWGLLNDDFGEDVIPVVGDAATVHWGLHLDVGERLSFRDAQDRPMELLIVGVVDNWIFQGALVADKSALESYFPSIQEDRWLLVDGGPGAPEAGALLHQRLQDHGVLLQRPEHLLEGYLRVERTFMLIFGVMGGLGMLLAVAGVGALSYRRLLERRRDVALLSALGFSDDRVQSVALGEMLSLLGSGITCGTIATLVALAPNLVRAEWAPLSRFIIVLFAMLLVATSGLFLVSRASVGRGRGQALQREY
jgi:ABC-type lipoprotein release transport system permease subunit